MNACFAFALLREGINGVVNNSAHISFGIRLSFRHCQMLIVRYSVYILSVLNKAYSKLTIFDGLEGITELHCSTNIMKLNCIALQQISLKLLYFARFSLKSAKKNHGKMETHVPLSVDLNGEQIDDHIAIAAIRSLTTELN